MDKFKHVVGIIHTNYVMYSQSVSFGQVKGSLVYLLNQGVCRAYCHKIIKLSATLQEFAPEKEIVCNVHGTLYEGFVMHNVLNILLALHDRCTVEISGSW